MRQEHNLAQIGWQRCSIVGALALFAVVHPCGMIAADPLTPAVQLQNVVRFVAGQLGVAHKPQMGLKPGVGNGLSQAGHPAGNATCLGIGVRAFKRENVKLHGTVLLLRQEMALCGICPCRRDKDESLLIVLWIMPDTCLLEVSKPPKERGISSTSSKPYTKIRYSSNVPIWQDVSAEAQRNTCSVLTPCPDGQGVRQGDKSFGTICPLPGPRIKQAIGFHGGAVV